MIGGMSTPPANWDARKGSIVRKRRQVMDLDQRDLAALVGVHVNSVQRWESGKQYPGRHLGKLEAVLGIVIDGDPGQQPQAPTPEELDELRDHIREVLGEESDIEAALDALSGKSPRNGWNAGGAGEGSGRRAG